MRLINFKDLHGDLNETLNDYFVAQETLGQLYTRQALARFKRDKFEASEWLLLKEDADPATGRAPSNDAVAFEIKDNEDFQALEKRYIHARGDYEKAQSMVKYLEYRLEAIRTVESTQRVELSHNLK